jgi:hypothetical protein
MISADACRADQVLLALVLLGLLTGCGPATVQVEGNFPSPLIAPLPLSMGVWYGEDFSRHEFFDEAKRPGESSWRVSTGAAQVEMWDRLWSGMFKTLVHLSSRPGAGRGRPGLDGVLIPHVEELQYTIPKYTNVKVYEVWLRYRFELVTATGEPIAEWSMTSYGKTPTAFLQSDQEAVNLAAVMALRDAGANFATNFTRVPALQGWLQENHIPVAGTAP